MKILKSIWACLVSAAAGLLPWFAFVLTTAFFQHPAGTSVVERFRALAEALSFTYTYEMAGPLVLVTCLIMLVIGMPLQALLQGFRRPGWLSLVVPATVIGAILMHLIVDQITVFELSPSRLETYRWSLRPEWLAFGGFMGFYHASIAWLVRRPDKDAPKDLP